MLTPFGFSDSFSYLQVARLCPQRPWSLRHFFILSIFQKLSGQFSNVFVWRREISNIFVLIFVHFLFRIADGSCAFMCCSAWPRTTNQRQEMTVDWSNIIIFSQLSCRCWYCDALVSWLGTAELGKTHSQWKGLHLLRALHNHQPAPMYPESDAYNALVQHKV